MIGKLLFLVASAYVCLGVPTHKTSGQTDFCKGRNNGNYVNPWDKHSFLQCSNGITYKTDCPARLCYNAAKNQCDQCPKSVKVDQHKGFCKKRKDGNYKNPWDRHSFLQCSNGITYKQVCPSKLCYRAGKDRCDYCTKSGKVTKGKGFCKKRKDGNYRNPWDRHSFFQCSNGITYKQICPVKLCYRSSNDRCDHCTKRGEVTTHKGFCKKRKDGNYRNPSDRHSFFQCSNGITYKQICPVKLCYRSSNDRCDYCTKRGNVKNFCKNRKPGRYQFPGYPYLYIVCIKKRPHVKRCPGIYCFDQKKKVCNFDCWRHIKCTRKP